MLDTKSAKGLTLGSAPSKEESTMKVLVLRGFMLNGEVPEVGSIVEVPDHQGRALIGSNKVEAVSDEAEKPAKKTKKKSD